MRESVKRSAINEPLNFPDTVLVRTDISTPPRTVRAQYARINFILRALCAHGARNNVTIRALCLIFVDVARTVMLCVSCAQRKINVRAQCARGVFMRMSILTCTVPLRDIKQWRTTFGEIGKFITNSVKSYYKLRRESLLQTSALPVLRTG